MVAEILDAAQMGHGAKDPGQHRRPDRGADPEKHHAIEFDQPIGVTGAGPRDVHGVQRGARGLLSQLHQDGLHRIATGLESLLDAVNQELDFVATGKGLAKWIRGEYGTGKTFAARYLCANARQRRIEK